MGFRTEWFGEYKQQFKDCEREVLSILADEKSKDIILNRVNFYKTGKVEYLTKIPVDTKEYFDTSYYPLSDSEVYVDCGAYTGDTLVDFVEAVDKFEKIYAFEPDAVHFEKLGERTSRMKDRERIHIFPYAIGEMDGKLRFEASATVFSHVCESGETEVEVKALDDIISDRVSFIKMDIEGSELAALKGAKRIIKQYKPKLAICVYHKCEDIFKIPLYLHELVPEYKIMIRQHRYDLYDTVLYAYVEN